MAKKKRDASSSGGLTWLGLLLGAAVGGAVALVYSPGTGEQNRVTLQDWAAERLQGRR